MTVGEFIDHVRANAARLPFITGVLVADQTDYAAKLILIIRPDLFIQLYANVDTGTRGYSLVCGGQRIYGRDRDAQGWHRHPSDNPLAQTSLRKGNALWRSATSFGRCRTFWRKNASCENLWQRRVTTPARGASSCGALRPVP